MSGSEIISIMQAASESGISRFTIRTQIHLHRIPAFKRPTVRGETWYMQRSDFDSYLLTRTGNSKPILEDYPWGEDAPVESRSAQHAPNPPSTGSIYQSLRDEAKATLQTAAQQGKAVKITPRDGDTMRACLARYRWAASQLQMKISSYKVGPSFGQPSEQEDSLVITLENNGAQN